MNQSAIEEGVKNQKRRFPVWAIVLVTVLVTIFATVGVIRYYFMPKPFDQIALSDKEQQRLDKKLKQLIPGYQSDNHPSIDGESETKPLEPEAYTEQGVSRDVAFTEREVNALLAKNTDLADKLAVDLSDDLVSAKLLVPVDPDFPVMGGKTLRINAGITLAFKQGKPVAILRGVSFMGVPVPNSWLGGIKNIDLVEQFGGGDGFWRNFSEGVDNIQVKEGKLNILLAE